jgi:hypothetical protein
MPQSSSGITSGQDHALGSKNIAHLRDERLIASANRLGLAVAAVEAKWIYGAVFLAKRIGAVSLIGQ